MDAEVPNEVVNGTVCGGLNATVTGDLLVIEVVGSDDFLDRLPEVLSDAPKLPSGLPPSVLLDEQLQPRFVPFADPQDVLGPVRARVTTDPKVELDDSVNQEVFVRLGLVRLQQHWFRDLRHRVLRRHGGPMSARAIRPGRAETN